MKFKSIILKIRCFLGIVNQGFTRIPIQEGEIKKEFDDMLMVFNQEHKEKELQNLEMAKKLQVSRRLNNVYSIK